MKAINYDTMASIQGGDIWAWVDGYCAGFAVATVLTVGAAAANPVGVVSGVGCAARGVYHLGKYF